MAISFIAISFMSSVSDAVLASTQLAYLLCSFLNADTSFSNVDVFISGPVSPPSGLPIELPTWGHKEHSMKCHPMWQ